MNKTLFAGGAALATVMLGPATVLLGLAALINPAQAACVPTTSTAASTTNGSPAGADTPAETSRVVFPLPAGTWVRISGYGVCVRPITAERRAISEESGEIIAESGANIQETRAIARETHAIFQPTRVIFQPTRATCQEHRKNIPESGAGHGATGRTPGTSPPGIGAHRRSFKEVHPGPS